MKAVLIVLALTCLTLTAAVKEVPRATVYYVQLIRGSIRDTPPQPGSHRVGPKLQSTFRSVFSLRSYWEIARREVAVGPGETTKLSLTRECEVEVDLRHPEVRKVTAFRNGHVVDRVIRPTSDAMSIIGGSRDSQSVWFIVVRRDKPPEEAGD